MAWPCFMVELAGRTEPEQTPGGGTVTRQLWKLPSGKIVGFDELPVGAMWFDACCECGRGAECPHANEERELCVKMPGGSNGSIWNIDQGKNIKARGGNPHAVWIREGEPPNVTVTPSINWIGHYHGWLHGGILTDDCEGRNLQ